MTISLYSIPSIILLLLAACWMAFAVVFFFRKMPPRTAESKREPASHWGIILQGIGFAFVWGARRPVFTPIAPMPRCFEFTLGILADVIAAVSVWICLAAVRTLGRQWAFVARLVEGHKLVTNGPYRFVRNPIYLGMFGMLVATGLVLSRWWGLLIAIGIFLIGNSIRIHSEEKLLRESFGAEFEHYAHRVPAMFPRLYLF